MRNISGRPLDGRTSGAPVAGDQSPHVRSAGVLEVVVTGLSSDAHTWNLVYLQLLLEELGCQVANLGPCTPDEVVVGECLRRRPDLVVVSSVNGHGGRDGSRLIGALRAQPELAPVPTVIGGQLDVVGGVGGGTAARLLAAGYDAVFDAAGDEPGAGLLQFTSFVSALTARAALRAVPGPGPARDSVPAPAPAAALDPAAAGSPASADPAAQVGVG